MKRLYVYLLALLVIASQWGCGTKTTSDSASATEQKIGVLLVNHGSHSPTWRQALLDLDSSVRETILRRDGGALLVAEKNHIFERRSGVNRTYFNGIPSNMVDYFFDELLIFSIHPDGKSHWQNILHKKQYSQDDGGVYSSYFLFKTSHYLRFLFNDEIRFENTISEYVLNGYGEYDRNSILSTTNLDLRLRFRDAVQVAANTLIVPSERRNRLKLVKMEF